MNPDNMVYQIAIWLIPLVIAPGANVVARVVGPIASAIVRGLLAFSGALT